MRWTILLWLLCCLAACGSRRGGNPAPPADAAGADAAMLDAATSDGGPDATTPDAGPVDVTPEVLVDALEPVGHTDIELDDAGSAHIAFTQADSITYLAEATGWAPEVIVSGATILGGVHIAISGVNVYVSYVTTGGTDPDTVVCERSAIEWNCEVVYNGDVASTSAPMIATPDGMFLAWSAWTDGTGGVEDYVVFSEHDGISWGSTRFLGRGRPHAADVDSLGLVHAIFFRDTLFSDSHLKQYRNERTGWLEYRVDDLLPYGYARFALDSTDRPHLAFADSDRGQLVYAYSARDGDDFEIDFVEGNDTAYTDIVIGPGDVPWIAYYKSGSRDVKLAIRNGPIWDRETLDHDGDVGQALSMTLSDANRAQLVYYDATRQQLKRVVR